MAFSYVSWLLAICVVLTAVPDRALSKSLPKLTVSEDQNWLTLQQHDSTVQKRSVSGSNSGITLNFNQGMRDFIVNGNGVSVQSQSPVAFQATLTTGQIGPNYALGVIKFNYVTVNLGNAYDPSTGKFTAPVKGLYQFSVAYLQQNGYQTHVRLMKNNAVHDDLHTNHKNYDTVSKTVLVTLDKGDTFWVKLMKSSVYAVHGNSRYTTFGGLLISTI